jgi:hypothetical protein
VYCNYYFVWFLLNAMIHKSLAYCTKKIEVHVFTFKIAHVFFICTVWLN